MNLLNPWTLFQVWCHVAPLSLVEAAPRADLNLPPDLVAAPEPAPAPDLNLPPDLVAAPGPAPEPAPAPEPKAMLIPAVPAIMGWLGSIGGVLGIISFTENYVRKIVAAIQKARDPLHDEKKGDPPWVVGVQVGLDGHGLLGAGGDFPQFCLWNTHGQLLGYNDQRYELRNTAYRWWSDMMMSLNDRPKGMPMIESGGLKTVGIWPYKDQKSLGTNQAVYVTMFKRHYNAVCIASVYVQWPDETRWVFDGTWGRASNMSWYFSYVYDSDSRQQECFWLDDRGDLNHHEDKTDPWIEWAMKLKMPDPQFVHPWLKPSLVNPESGIPEGDNLNEGMRENGVADRKVPLGVKWHVPALKAAKYGDNIDNLTIDDFALNPAKMHWHMSPMWKSVRGGSPLLPILHPQANLSEKDPELIWEDEYNQEIPSDCMTDVYHDYSGKVIKPGTGDRCRMSRKWPGQDVVDCRDPYKPKKARAVDAPVSDDHTLPLQERHARTLVIDRNKRGGSGTKELCEDAHSVGPSYANHQEGFFCRMTDKTLWPFCDSAAGVSHDCFDAEAEVLVDTTRPVGKRTLYWDAIEDWHSGDRFRRAA